MPRVRRHMPQLDSLRAIAVSLVLFQHFAGVEWPMLNGRTGVILFFILSGFLITGILLDSRSAAGEAGSAAVSVLPRFYARRFLRIVPAFYAVLAVTYMARIGDVTHYVAWHMAYLSNVLFCIQGVWPKTTSHLWSLAVEEQFYLAWPLVVLFVPYRRLFAVTAALVFAGPVARLVVQSVSQNVIAPYVLPICVLDSFGLGAALACAFRQPIGSGRLLRIGSIAAAAACAVIFALLSWWGWNGRLRVTVSDTLIAVMLLPLIAAAAEGVPGVAGRMLGARPLRYVGRVSYGIYLWHLFVPALFFDIVHRLSGSDLAWNRAALAGAWTVVTLAISALSWHLFETPINRLKRYIPYVAAPARRGSGTGAASSPLVRG